MKLIAIPVHAWTEEMRMLDAVARNLEFGSKDLLIIPEHLLCYINWLECDCRSGAYYITFFEKS